MDPDSRMSSHKKKEFIGNQRKGETYVSKLGNNIYIEPQNIAQVLFYTKILEIGLTRVKRLIKNESLKSFSWKGSLRSRVSSQLSWKKGNILVLVEGDRWIGISGWLS